MFGKRGAAEEVARPRPGGAPTPSPESQSQAPPKPAAQAAAQAPQAPQPAKAPTPAPSPSQPAAGSAPRPSPGAQQTLAVDNRSDHYYHVKTMIFSALIDTIDLAQLGQLDVDSAREEIRDIVNEIITIKSVVMS